MLHFGRRMSIDDLEYQALCDKRNRLNEEVEDLKGKPQIRQFIEAKRAEIAALEKEKAELIAAQQKAPREQNMNESEDNRQ
jgi:hypothetical protein